MCNTVHFTFDGTKVDEMRRGFIDGIAYMLTGRLNERKHWIRKEANGKIMHCKAYEATADQAKAIEEEIRKLFPDAILWVH